jgi:hypothetical protein
MENFDVGAGYPGIEVAVQEVPSEAESDPFAAHPNKNRDLHQSGRPKKRTLVSYMIIKI